MDNNSISNVYGPVPSRRLGRSLGIDVVPALPDKTCNYNCVYCQLGRTKHLINDRKEFFSPENIFSQIKLTVDKVGVENIDYLTFVGDGEPLLYSKIGDVVKKIKENIDIPICIITNGSLLADIDVREEIKHIDVIMPTLDAGNALLFKKINRPVRSVKFHEMVEGMIKFRDIFSGEIWMEYMAIKGLNDENKAILEVKTLFERIKPDRIYVNTPIRPPTEKWAVAPTDEDVNKIKIILNSVIHTHDINRDEEGDFHIEGSTQDNFVKNLLKTIKRHPMTEHQVVQACKVREMNPHQVLDILINQKNVFRYLYRGNIYLILRKE